jgi:hypothetical protein
VNAPRDERRVRLEAAYRAARYRIAVPGGAFELTVGRPSEELERLLAAHGCRRWALLAAANPGSRRLGERENQRRLARLDRELERRGLVAFEGENRDPAGIWPAEASRLLLDVDQEAARALAAAFGQAAILAGETGGAPRLVWID